MQATGELTVRTRERGGGMRSKVYFRGRRPPSAPRMLVLVHGYANSESQARKSYEALIWGLKRSWPDGRLPEVWYFYWPGDTRWPVISQASFPLQIRRAKQAGGLLATFLYERRGNDPSPEVILLAHSLGCRVVLEAIRLLDEWATANRPRRTRVASTCLMAAAVPVSLCRDGQELGGRREDRHEVVLWSTWDLVLTCLFPPGEAAGLDGICLRSVGSSGQPEQRWKTPRRPSTGLGHSDYYADRRAADEIAGQLLRWRVPRALPYQELAERPIFHPENTLERRELASRSPGSPAPTWLPA